MDPLHTNHSRCGGGRCAGVLSGMVVVNVLDDKFFLFSPWVLLMVAVVVVVVVSLCLMLMLFVVMCYWVFFSFLYSPTLKLMLLCWVVLVVSAAAIVLVLVLVFVGSGSVLMIRLGLNIRLRLAWVDPDPNFFSRFCVLIASISEFFLVLLCFRPICSVGCFSVIFGSVLCGAVLYRPGWCRSICMVWVASIYLIWFGSARLFCFSSVLFNTVQFGSYHSSQLHWSISSE